MHRTIISKDDWRLRNGKLQLLCPKCFVWFTLDDRYFSVSEDGNVSDVAYHSCNSDYRDDDDGWVVAATLEEWTKI